ncbi:MAG TPA: hypothetical protein PKN32_10675 [Bacteroidales bacterium]|nr:hypothetical protein [Bacteroidales bacterium]
MKKRTLLFVFVSLLFLGNVFSQTDVQILDIVVNPVFEYDTVTEQPIVTENEQLNIMFKINSAANADKVYVLFGTAQDTGDVLSLEADIEQENSTYYIVFNGIQEQIVGYTAQLFLELTPAQKDAYNDISLYVKDNQAEESNRLYFVK